MNAHQLFKVMKPIRYALWDYKHKRVLTPDDKEWDIDGYIYDNCCVLKPEQVWKKKIGTCYDCSLLEYYELKRNGYNNIYSIYYEGISETTGFGTHTTIIYQELKDNLWYWFEYSWVKQRGIHGPYLDKIIAYSEIKEAEKKNKRKLSLFKENINKAFDSLLKLDFITIKDFDKYVFER